jgi:S1-C subfamily serine protease
MSIVKCQKSQKKEILMKKFVLVAFALSPFILGSLPTFGLSSESITSLEKEVNDLFEKVKPSVVTVKYSTRSKSRRDLVTTGVLIDKEGNLLTTKGFSGKPRVIRVELSNGEEREAEWVGWDRETKLAILKIKGKPFTPALIGNSDNVKTASWAMIVGNSMGLSPSASIGHVSGRREGDLLQLSNNVTPGSSGAGVFNTKGELIGIVAASLSSFRMVQLPRAIEEGIIQGGGSGVAIPINRAMKTSQMIVKEGGDLEPGWLGVYIQNLDDDLKESLDADQGALVSKVVDDSPAEKAGIQEGDVIISIDKEDIKNTNSLQRVVKKKHPGSDVTVSVLRKGKKKNLKAKIGERESDFSRTIIEDLDIQVPDVDMFRGFTRRFTEENEGKMRKEMDHFKQEMKKFRKEMKELKKELSQMKKKKI